MIHASSTFMSEDTETSFTCSKFDIGKTRWVVTYVKGTYNYVSVRKVTANPFGVLGTEFKDFNEAVAHYKNPTMKMNLRLIELELN